MAVDASIALQNFQPQAFDPSRAFQLAEAITEYRQKNAETQRQNALRQLLGQPGAMDPATGAPTANTLSKVMAIDPGTGLKLQQNALTMMSERTQLQNAQLKRHGIIQEMIDPVRDAALNAHDEVLKKGGSEEEASAAGQKALDDGLAPIRNGGQLSDAEKSQLRTKFDYLPMKSAALSYKERATLDKQDAKDKRDEKRLDIAERREGSLEKALTDKEASAKDKKEAAAEGEIDDDTASKMARQYLTGDTSVMANIGRGAQSGKNIAKVRRAIYTEADRQGMTPEEIAAKVAEFQGIKAGERTLGTRTAQVGMAVNEAKLMVPLVRESSAKVDRTKYPSINSLILAAEKGTGDENVVKFGVALNSFINIYARAVSPTGTPTVSDKDHARELLDKAWSDGQINAALDQMQKEMSAAGQSPGQTRAEFREAVKGEKSPVSDSVPDTAKASKFEEGKVYVDAKGNKARYVAGKWVEVK